MYRLLVISTLAVAGVANSQTVKSVVDVDAVSHMKPLAVYDSNGRLFGRFGGLAGNFSSPVVYFNIGGVSAGTLLAGNLYFPTSTINFDIVSLVYTTSDCTGQPYGYSGAPGVAGATIMALPSGHTYLYVANGPYLPSSTPILSFMQSNIGTCTKPGGSISAQDFGQLYPVGVPIEITNNFFPPFTVK